VTTPRPHPFELVFADLAADRFPSLRNDLGDERSMAHFLMTPAVIELLHELRPDEGLDDAVDDFVAFVHAAFWYWRDGERTVSLEERGVRNAMEAGGRRTEDGGGHPPSPLSILDPPSSAYVQIAPRILWGRLDSADIHEPIDGWFAIPEGDGLRVVACLGVHPERPGLSVLVAVGPVPTALVREDGSAPFAPAMEGGAAAGLHSVTNAEELLWLAWSARRGLEP
jgi:hypothetical protein